MTDDHKLFALDAIVRDEFDEAGVHALLYIGDGLDEIAAAIREATEVARLTNGGAQ